MNVNLCLSPKTLRRMTLETVRASLVFARRMSKLADTTTVRRPEQSAAKQQQPEAA